MVEPAISKFGIGANGGVETNNSSTSGIRNSDSNGSLSEQGQIVFTMPLVQMFRISASVSVHTLAFLSATLNFILLPNF